MPKTLTVAPCRPSDHCDSCAEEDIPEGECLNSPLPCHHHCNHSWPPGGVNPICHWCGEKNFD